MKSCPTCNKTFTDPNLSFCLDDGTPLVSFEVPADETTAVSPSLGDTGENVPPLPTEVYKPRDWQAPDYQPPGFQVSTPAPARKKAWPWVVGILALALVGVIVIGIGGVLAYKLLRPESNRNSSNPVADRSGDTNSNLNANAPDSQTENGDTPVNEDDATPPPTDKEIVLASLTDLEHEWTVANINADKKKLNRILADDYVGRSAEGKIEGKAEYLRAIKRDTEIQKWNFEDLKVTLFGDRATLDGVIRLQLSDRELAFKFTDKFVWRAGRWQAVGSEISQIE